MQKNPNPTKGGIKVIVEDVGQRICDQCLTQTTCSTYTLKVKDGIIAIQGCFCSKKCMQRHQSNLAKEEIAKRKLQFPSVYEVRNI